MYLILSAQNIIGFPFSDKGYLLSYVWIVQSVISYYANYRFLLIYVLHGAVKGDTHCETKTTHE